MRRRRSDDARGASRALAPGGAGAVLLVAAAALLALAAPRPLAAQGLGFGLEVDGGYRALQGEDFESVENGWSTHVLAGYAWSSGWEVGAGAGISFHDPENGADVDGDITEAFGFARYRFGVPGSHAGHLHPFLEARGGLARFSTATPDVDDVSSDGAMLGGQAGVEYWMSDAVGVVGALGVEYLTFSGDDDLPAVLPDRSGWSLRPHVGLKVRY